MIVMSPYDFLRADPEPTPKWLVAFNSGDRFDRSAFFGSRVVYYPGAGTDGHPVKLFGSTHHAHCFVHADYAVSEEELNRILDEGPYNFKGYHTLERIRLQETDLVPHGWEPHFSGHDSDMYRFAHVRPFGFLEILQRDPEMETTHGPERLAVMFLGADGIATYDALFCQPGSIQSPHALLLQDHGFGGNYNRFGSGGLMERIAMSTNIFPKLIMSASNTHIWHSYERIPDVDGDRGGLHNAMRFLYRSTKYRDRP
jgi:hypothetical protein